VGWLKEIFGAQPICGRGRMWIGPGLAFAAVAGHVGGTGWHGWSREGIALMVLFGSCVGVAEELATCGLAVKMLRDAGHGERFVVIVSSPLFALVHMTNLLSGMRCATVAARRTVRRLVILPAVSVTLP